MANNKLRMTLVNNNYDNHDEDSSIDSASQPSLPIKLPQYIIDYHKNNDIIISNNEEIVDYDIVDNEDNDKIYMNSISTTELQEAPTQRLIALSRYRKIFAPFITKQVMELLNNILKNKKHRQLDDDDDIIIEQPSILASTCKLRAYQLEGLSWLVYNYNHSINCILADEMGLGKTLQSIAFVAHLVHTKQLSGPFLFIVPLSVLFNWISEFKVVLLLYAISLAITKSNNNCYNC